MPIIPAPKLGDSVDSVVVVEWYVAPGDQIKIGQLVASLATDKVDTDWESPVEGKVVALHAQVDDEISVGEPLFEVDG